MGLSAEEQVLLKTQFSPELEKEAAESVKLASELYTTGHDKLAAETAELLEKMAAEEEEEEEEDHGKKLNDEQKKEASVRGAFIAQGFIDGLKKLGSDKYQDEMAYLAPFVEEKLAGYGKTIINKTKRMFRKAKDYAGEAVDYAKENPKKTIGAGLGVAGLGAGALALKGKKKKED